MATLYQKTKLLQGLLTGDIACQSPLHIAVDLTSRCNLLCPDCQYHSPFLNRSSLNDHAIKDMPTNLFEKLCKELKTMGTRHLILTGEGEPFLHPRLFDIISVAKTAGFNIILFTNGTLLDEARIRSLIETRLDILKVSLWASSPEEYEQNYPESKPDNFGKIVDRLKLLKDIKAAKHNKFPDVVLHHPINRQNFKSINAMIDLAYIIGSNTLSFSPLWSLSGRSALSPDEERSLFRSLARLRKRLDSLSIKHNIKEALLRYKLGETVWEKLPCYVA